MISLKLNMEGDGCWPDLQDPKKKVILVQDTQMELAVLPGGMKSGKPSVAIRINLPGGAVVFAETSLALFLSSADAFKAKYGDPR
jgi:hypothetical protein